MSTLAALAKAQAAEVQRAQRLCLYRHIHISRQPLVIVPLAMDGEANAPLAALIGELGGSPRLLTVAEPRDRDQRFAFAADLAAIVLDYIDTGSEDPQLLVPNPPAVTFLKLLGRSTRLRRTTGQWAVPPAVPLLGRWLTFFTDRYEHPASSLMLAMTDALTQHWATGQSGLEDGNLAAVLAWIDPPEGQTASQAARAAEDPLLSPPAGPATDPSFDNEVLDPLMRAVRSATLTGDGRAYDRAKAAYDNALATQLVPTWRLMRRAGALLGGLPEAAHVRQRHAADNEAVLRHREHISSGGPPQPRRDGAVSAARRLAMLERTQEMVSAQRAFDDPLVMAEYRLQGDAFAGRVIAAEPGRTVKPNTRQLLRPLITIATLDGPDLEGRRTVFTSPSRPAQQAIISDITRHQEWLHITLELSGGMGRKLIAEPGSVPELGDYVCYAAFTDTYRQPPAFPEPDATPWTHGGPPPVFIPADDDAREAWS